MASKRGAITMTDEEQAAYLESGHTLQVASNGVRGFPHVVAMWYVVIDGKVHFTTFRKSQKVQNLRRDPKVTVMLEGGKAYSELKGLVIEGSAEVLDDADLTAEVMSTVGKKYSGYPMPTETRDQALAAGTKRLTIRITPDRAISWDHGKLGGKY